MYRGLGSGLAGVVPYVGLNMSIYESMKTYFLSKYEHSQTPKLITVVSGAISSGIAQLFVYPTALVMTRMQASGNAKFQNSESPSPNVMQTVKQIMVKDGFPGFYKGLSVNYMKTLPAVAISFFMYENLKHFFKL